MEIIFANLLSLKVVPFLRKIVGIQRIDNG